MTPLRRRAAKVAIALSIAALIAVSVTNAIVLSIGGERVYARIDDVPPRAVGIVLGAGLSRDGRPSIVLLDRLETGLDLYRRGRRDSSVLRSGVACGSGKSRSSISSDGIGFLSNKRAVACRQCARSRRPLWVNCWKSCRVSAGQGSRSAFRPQYANRYTRHRL